MTQAYIVVEGIPDELIVKKLLPEEVTRDVALFQAISTKPNGTCTLVARAMLLGSCPLLQRCSRLLRRAKCSAERQRCSTTHPLGSWSSGGTSLLHKQEQYRILHLVIA